MHLRIEFHCVAAAVVDMDHLLSGTTYAKAPRWRGITIGCHSRSDFGRMSSPVLDTLGRSTLVKSRGPSSDDLHRVVPLAKIRNAETTTPPFHLNARAHKTSSDNTDTWPYDCE